VSTTASAVSRVVRAASPELKKDRRLVQIMDTKEEVLIYTPNVAQHQLDALGRIEKFLESRGYAIEVFETAGAVTTISGLRTRILRVTK
jgi:hypothetical protein